MIKIVSGWTSTVLSVFSLLVYSFINWRVYDLRDIVVMKMETGNYFSGLDSSTICPYKGKICKHCSFIKVFIDMNVPHLFGNIQGWNILQLFVLWQQPLYQLSKDIFSRESPRWKDWSPVWGHFCTYSINACIYSIYIDHNVEYTSSVWRCSRVSQISDFSCTFLLHYFPSSQ